MKNKIIGPVLMWVIILFGVVLVVSLLPSYRIIPRNMFSPFLFIPGLLIWGYFYFGALWVNHRLILSVAKTHTIVTQGVYGRLRHPVFFANFFLFWGIFFTYPTLKLFASVLWLSLVMIYWARLEEKQLIKKFGNIYRVYIIKTPMFWPKKYLEPRINLEI